MKKIIAITGLKGSGKDTTADYIIKNYDITNIIFNLLEK